MSDLEIKKKNSQDSTHFSPESSKSPEQPQLASFAQYSGPIPPPNFLIQYEQLLPGIAKRFLEEPHVEAQHRRVLEELLVQEQIKLSRRGQKMAFCLATVYILGAFSAIFLGYSIEGLGALVVSVATFAGIFIYAKKR